MYVSCVRWSETKAERKWSRGPQTQTRILSFRCRSGLVGWLLSSSFSAAVCNQFLGEFFFLISPYMPDITFNCPLLEREKEKKRNEESVKYTLSRLPLKGRLYRLAEFPHSKSFLIHYPAYCVWLRHAAATAAASLQLITSCVLCVCVCVCVFVYTVDPSLALSCLSRFNILLPFACPSQQVISRFVYYVPK